MNNSYVEVTIPDGMLEYMQCIQTKVDEYLVSKPDKEYITYRSWWTLKLIEHRVCVGVHIPEHLAEWIKEIFYTEEYWCLDCTQLYNSLRELIWLFRLNNKALLNQLHAAHFKQILDKFKGE